MCSSSDYFDTDEQLFTWTAQYPVTGSMMKRTAVTRTAQYPVTFGTDSYFLCTCTMSMPRIYEFIELYCTVFYTLTHRMGVVGNFSFNSVQARLAVTCLNFFTFGGFSLATFTPQPGSYSLHISTFSLILKGFNIGQWNILAPWQQSPSSSSFSDVLNWAASLQPYCSLLACWPATTCRWVTSNGDPPASKPGITGGQPR